MQNPRPRVLNHGARGGDMDWQNTLVVERNLQIIQNSTILALKTHGFGETP